jgi:hypothetical protein
MKAGANKYIRVFLTSKLIGGEWLALHSGRLNPGIEPPEPIT